MTRVVAIDHPALRKREGQTPEEAALTDRQRVAVLLQAAAVLSHLRFADWHLVAGWGPARIDDRGALVGLEAAPGTTRKPNQSLLRELATRLFAADERVAGRGPARRVVRRLLAGWQHDLATVDADQAVTQLLEDAAFLWHEPFGSARSALAAVHTGSSGEVLWVAGPGHFRSAVLARAPDGEAAVSLLASAQAVRLWDNGREDPERLRSAGNWRAASAAWRSRKERQPEDRVRFGEVLFGLGRFESCLREIARLRRPAARVLRLRCLHRLGRLRAARRELEKLRAADLDEQLLVETADVAVRLYGNLGRRAHAAEWVERVVSGVSGDDMRAEAELIACAEAWDRRDGQAMRSHLEAAARLSRSPEKAWRWHKASGQEALSRGRGDEAAKALTTALRLNRRGLSPLDAGDLWNELAIGRSLDGDLAGAERALRHVLRLHREAEGPRKTTLALFNLAEVRLRRGRLEGVAEILRQSTRENRQAGNWRGLIHDLELLARYDLVRGRPSSALAGAEAALDESATRCGGWRSSQLRVLAARALGWLGRSEDAAAHLEQCQSDWLADLEPEERPALLALGGRREEALEVVAEGPAAGVWRGILTGSGVDERHWDRAAKLESYRFARLVFDVEAVEPGRASPPLVRRAAATLRRVGADRLAERLEAGTRTGWEPVARFLEAGEKTRETVCRLVSDVGGGEIGLVFQARGADVGEVLVEGPPSGEELRATVDGSELRLTAAWIDPLVRVVFQLALQALGGDGSAAVTATRERGGIVGESAPFRGAIERLDLLAPEAVPVLLRGETGTGKELAARRVHDLSSRSGGPFVAFNCAAVTRDLLMSDLFGHVRGAFTGAARDRAGIFETARGGTVFLDEVGDLPLEAQGFLLRVLQEGEVRRVGESLPRSTDVRIVAASHRNLDEMVGAGSFRADLFFRLRVATVELPALRDRGRDILLLAEHFLARLRPGGAPGLSAAARAALMSHHWPGNVRELQNVLSVAVALAAGRAIEPQHLGLERARVETRRGYHEQVLLFRRRLIQEALASSGGNLAAAARRLGITRQALSYLVRKLEIER